MIIAIAVPFTQTYSMHYVQPATGVVVAFLFLGIEVDEEEEEEEAYQEVEPTASHPLT